MHCAPLAPRSAQTTRPVVHAIRSDRRASPSASPSASPRPARGQPCPHHTTPHRTTAALRVVATRVLLTWPRGLPVSPCIVAMQGPATHRMPPPADKLPLSLSFCHVCFFHPRFQSHCVQAKRPATPPAVAAVMPHTRPRRAIHGPWLLDREPALLRSPHVNPRHYIIVNPIHIAVASPLVRKSTAPTIRPLQPCDPEHTQAIIAAEEHLCAGSKSSCNLIAKSAHEWQGLAVGEDAPRCMLVWSIHHSPKLSSVAKSAAVTLSSLLSPHNMQACRAGIPPSDCFNVLTGIVSCRSGPRSKAPALI